MVSSLLSISPAPQPPSRSRLNQFHTFDHALSNLGPGLVKAKWIEQIRQLQGITWINSNLAPNVFWWFTATISSVLIKYRNFTH